MCHKRKALIYRDSIFQYEYFFENGPLPIVYEHTEQALTTTPRSQTNLLLDNVSKIERKCRRILSASGVSASI